MIKKKRTAFIAITIITALAVFIAGLIFIFGTKDSRYTYLEGTVTTYDETPSYADGFVIFSINNVEVDIGGGLRPSSVYGTVDSPLKVGDRVEAKLVKTDSGKSLTIYNCEECYVKKID